MTVTLACHDILNKIIVNVAKRLMNNDTASCLKEQANKNDYTSMGTPSLRRLQLRPYLSHTNVHLHLLHKSTVKNELATFSMAGGDNNVCTWTI